MNNEKKVIQDDYAVPDGIEMVEDSPLASGYSFLHYHQVIEIGIVREGSGIFSLAGEVLPFTKGCVTAAFPGAVHIGSSAGEQPCRFDYLLIEPERAFFRIPYLLGKLSCLKLAGGVYHDLEICSLAERLKEEIQKNSKSFLAQLLCAELLERIFRASEKTQNTALPDALLPALGMITMEYDTPITCRKLAERCYLSETSFRRMFRAAMGVSPMEYLYKTRIAAAAALLESGGKSVLEIANTVGYESASSFYRHFRRFTGHTPKRG